MGSSFIWTRTNEQEQLKLRIQPEFEEVRTAYSPGNCVGKTRRLNEKLVTFDFHGDLNATVAPTGLDQVTVPEKIISGVERVWSTANRRDV